jgi:hypothetical protein
MIRRILKSLGFEKRERGPQLTYLTVSVSCQSEELPFMIYSNKGNFPKGAFNEPLKIERGLSFQGIVVYFPTENFYEKLKNNISIKLTIIVDNQTITPKVKCEIEHMDIHDMQIIFRPPIKIPPANVQIKIEINVKQESNV